MELRPQLIAVTHCVAAVFLSLSCGHSEGTTGLSVASEATKSAEGAFSLVIRNAYLYADGIASDIDAVALRGTKIAALGKSSELGARCKGGCALIDAKAGFLMPGFHDAHVHLFTAGEEEYELQIKNSSKGSIPKIQAEVRDYSREHPRHSWIVGRGWSATRLSTLPTRFDLDAAEALRPVALTDQSGHNLWTNSAAMAAAGITKNTADPFQGKIVRNADGEPTGIFLDAARWLVLAKQPPLSEAERAKYILTGQKRSLRAACTAMQGGPVTFEQAETYARLDREGRLTQRAFLWAPLLATEADFQRWVAFARGLPKSGKVQIVAFKGLADGTFAASTAALLAPYASDPSSRGELYITQSRLNAAVVRANREGFPAAIHAIGDRAARSALDAFAFSKQTLNHELLNRVEHATLVDPEDTRRFGELGVAASIQPIWLYGHSSSDSFLSSPTNRLGAERARRLYAWQDLSSGGAMLLFGSDLPSSDLVDPVTGLFSAIARQFPNGESFTSDERIDADLAMHAYTYNPARAIGWGDRIGKIAVGYEADLVLLDHDPRRGSKGLADNPMKQMWIAGHPIERASD